MTIGEIAAATAIITSIGGAGLLLVKFGMNYMQLKFDAKYKDYKTDEELKKLVKEVMAASGFMNNTEMRALIADVIAQSKIVTMEELSKFCKQAQVGCPRNHDLADLTLATTSLTNNVKLLLSEQKDILSAQSQLREKDLPKQYVNKEFLEEVVKRIEGSVGDIKTLVTGMQNQMVELARYVGKADVKSN